MRLLLSLLLLCWTPQLFAQIDLPVDTAVTVPVNIAPITDDAGAVDNGLVYNETGLSLVWVFTTEAGVVTETAVTPTDTGGNYDWVDNGISYEIEIPASGGASINNDTEGSGYFMGDCTATLPWRGPVIRFFAKTLLALMDGVPREMVIPSSSNNVYVFNITLVDGSNTKVSATTGPTLTLEAEDGTTDLSSWITDTTPAASGTGVYPVTITVPSTATAKTVVLGISGSATGYTGFVDEAAIRLVDADNIYTISSITTAIDTWWKAVVYWEQTDNGDIEITNSGTDPTVASDPTIYTDRGASDGQEAHP